MNLIDTHTHLYLPEFDSDRDEMVCRAVSSGVTKLLMPNIDNGSVNAMLSAADKYKNTCYPMIGLHPTSVKADFNFQLDMLEKTSLERKFLAVGEIGIDLYWDKTFLNEQLDAFGRQISFAIGSDLPVVIHSRESFAEVISVLEGFSGKKPTGVFHSFPGTIKDAEKVIRMGFMLGIGGPLTFKNSRLADIVREAGLGNIILETDSPYLSPVPYRGKRNESSYLCLVNKKLAEILNITEEESADATFKNSCRLFKI
ncbi:MAG: TatD family hydrolase [Bacteroidales bacterium]|jgi:TatD DNase family protein